MGYMGLIWYHPKGFPTIFPMILVFSWRRPKRVIIPWRMTSGKRSVWMRRRLYEDSQGCMFFIPGSKETTKSAWCNDIMIIVLIVYIYIYM